MSAVPSILTDQRSVESFDIDCAGRLKPHVLFAFLLNCAWKHANGTSFGFEELWGRGLMWVLAKFQLSVECMPRWRDELAIETWGKGTERFYALRDYRVLSPRGEKLASATSAWLILDRASRRPQRMDEMRETFPWRPGQSEIDTDLSRLPGSDGGDERASFRAAFSDIDVNGHVTAVRYLQWILDSFPRGLLEGGGIRRLDISFLAEAMLDDEVVVRVAPIDGCHACSVLRSRDQRELCRARVEWSTDNAPGEM